MLSNLVEFPMEEKFKRINLLNPSFKKKIGSMNGGVSLFQGAGFTKDDTQKSLVLLPRDFDVAKVRIIIEMIDRSL